MGLEQVPPDLPPDRLVKHLGILSWNSKDGGNGEDDAKALKLAGDRDNRAADYYDPNEGYGK